MFIKRYYDKWQNFRKGEQICIGRGRGLQEGSECGYKRATWGILVVMNLLCILTKVVDTRTYTWHVCTELNTYTQRNKYKTGEIWIRSVDCINVNIPVMIVYYHFARCYHWGKLVKIHRPSLHSLIGLTISIKILIKKIKGIMSTLFPFSSLSSVLGEAPLKQFHIEMEKGVSISSRWWSQQRYVFKISCSDTSEPSRPHQLCPQFQWAWPWIIP